jgi:hypothetical protein
LNFIFVLNICTHASQAWEVRDKKASLAAIKKLDGHTDYVSGRNVILALASNAVDDATKRKMADTLLQQPKVEIPKGKPHAPHVYEDSELIDFINSESWLFFQVRT